MIPESLLLLGKDLLHVQELICDLHPFLGCWDLIFTTPNQQKVETQGLKM